MRIKLLCVGKLKEAYWRDAAAEYAKRLTRYRHIEIIEVPDEPAAKTLSAAQRKLVCEREGEALLSRIDARDFVVALCVDGRALSSVELAGALAQWELEGSSVTFVIGGSEGLGGNVLARSQMQLSFSRMTFPHQVMRVILLEQLYRSVKINAGETYHK